MKTDQEIELSLSKLNHKEDASIVENHADLKSLIFENFALELSLEVDDDKAVGENRQANILCKINKKIDASAPQGGKTLRDKQGEWLTVAKGVELKVLHRDIDNQVQMSLLRMAPGAKLNEHSHIHDEECLVIEGELSIGEHTVRKGDFHFMKAGSFHHSITSNTGCLIYLRHDLIEAA